MGRKVDSKVCKCGRCGIRTVHNKNSNDMGFGQIVFHIFMGVITMGIWLVLLFLGMAVRGLFSFGGWYCSQCGK